MVKQARPISWRDEYYQTVERIVLTERELPIPGIRTSGWHDMKNASPALQAHYHQTALKSHL